MTYILFHRTTGAIIKSYDTLSGARRGMTVKNKNAGWESFARVFNFHVESIHGRHCEGGIAPKHSYGLAPYSIAHEVFYNKFVAELSKQTRTVTNLMTGEQVEESVTTPYHCSVSSESYWSN